MLPRRGGCGAKKALVAVKITEVVSEALRCCTEKASYRTRAAFLQRQKTNT